MMDTLFPYTRRITRKPYAVRLLVCLLVSAALLVWRREVVFGHQATESMIFLAVLAVVLIIIQAQIVARLRDVGASVLISALVFVPYVNAALAFALLLFPSREPAAGSADVPLSADLQGG